MIIWAVCDLVTLCAALTYVELGTTVRETGGEFIYVLRIYGPLHAFFVAYTFTIVVKPAGIAAVALSFAQYALAPFYPDCIGGKMFSSSVHFGGGSHQYDECSLCHGHSGYLPGGQSCGSNGDHYWWNSYHGQKWPLPLWVQLWGSVPLEWLCIRDSGRLQDGTM